jgi:hypothetical protein
VSSSSRASSNSPLIASSTARSTQQNARMVGSSPAMARNSLQRSIPSSTGSGPKIALIISQPMLSARSAAKLPRSA